MSPGRIVALGSVTEAAHETVDARGLWVTPGFVEAGIYANLKKRSGYSAPRLLGTSKPEAVARAVMKVIENGINMFQYYAVDEFGIRRIKSIDSKWTFVIVGIGTAGDCPAGGNSARHWPLNHSSSVPIARLEFGNNGLGAASASTFIPSICQKISQYGVPATSATFGECVTNRTNGLPL